MQYCIDLMKMFGREYRIDRDPAYFAEYGENAHRRDPWHWRILCKNGHFFPHSGTHLAASTNRRGAIANRLTAIPGVRVTQDGSDGINIVFPLRLFADVAALMKPRKRRLLTPEHRHTLVTAGKHALTGYRNSYDTFDGLSGAPLPGCTYQVAS